nr:uncharacterized protein LOC131771902 [Pocillopora verrucosa]
MHLLSLIVIPIFLFPLVTVRVAGNTNHSNTGGDQYDLHQCISEEYINLKEGKSFQIFWRRSSLESSKGEEFRGYRLAVNSVFIAYMPKYSLNMTCITFINDPSWKEFCHKRLEFCSNTTHILLILRNISSDEHWDFTLTHVLKSTSACNPQDIKIVRVIMPSPVVLSTVSVVPHNTVRTPISETTGLGRLITPSVDINNLSGSSTASVVPTPISTTLTGSSSSVQNTARPPTTGTGNRYEAIISVPIVVLAVLIALLSWCCCKRSRRQSDPENIAVQLDSSESTV